jgi:hypothetical protein
MFGLLDSCKLTPGAPEPPGIEHSLDEVQSLAALAAAQLFSKFGRSRPKIGRPAVARQKSSNADMSSRRAPSATPSDVMNPASAYSNAAFQLIAISFVL